MLGDQQAVLLLVERHRSDAAEGLVVEIGEARIHLEVLEEREDVRRGGGLDGEADVGIAGAIGRRQRGDHRQRGRDGGDAQVPGQSPAQGGDVLVHGAGIRDDAAGPGQHPLALRREALEAGPSLDELDPELVLKLLHPRREGLLRDAARLGRPAEMLLAGEGEEEVELVDHRRLSPGAAGRPGRDRNLRRFGTEGEGRPMLRDAGRRNQALAPYGDLARTDVGRL